MVKDKLLALQMLRGVSACLVVCDHVILNALNEGWLYSEDQWLHRFAWALGDLGVFTFFVISGFIMMHASGDHFGRGKAKQFAIKRVIRIAPLYWLATAVAALLLLVSGHGPSSIDLVASLAFVTLPQGPEEPMRPLLAQGWTLTYEAIFYCLFGFALQFSRRIGLTLISIALIGLVIVGAISQGALVATGARGALAFYTSVLFVLFLSGMMVQQVAAKLPSLDFPWAAVTSLVPLAACLLISSNSSFAGLWWIALAFLAATSSVLIAALGRKGGSGLAERIAAATGDASYSIYLFHGFVLLVVGKMLVVAGLGSFWLFLLVGAPLSVVLGHLIFTWFERPLTEWLRWRTASRAVIRV